MVILVFIALLLTNIVASVPTGLLVVGKLLNGHLDTRTSLHLTDHYDVILNIAIYQ